MPSLTTAVIGCLLAIGHADLAAQANVYIVPLTYNAPDEGPQPNFSPIGARVPLAEGDFSDDGPPAVGTLERNERTSDVWHRFPGVELRVRTPGPERTEPYHVDCWLVHRADEPAADTIMRYSRRSWRSGSVTVNGVPALVAAMDGNNDALYGPGRQAGLTGTALAGGCIRGQQHGWLVDGAGLVTQLFSRRSDLDRRMTN